MESRYDRLQSGLNIHSLTAQTAGSEELPPLVLLHGYPVNAYLWRHCIPELSKRFRVYAPDLPGHGKSDKPLDVTYNLDFFVDFLRDYFDTLKLERANLVIHDLGGMAGLGFAARNQERVKRLIVMNTLPYKEWPQSMHDFYRFARSPIWSKFLLFKSIFKSTFLEDKNIVYNSEAVKPDALGHYHGQWVESRESRKAFSRVLSGEAEEMSVPPELLRKMDIPTLVLWGENDRAIGKELGERLTIDLPDAKMSLISECGHFSPEEQPEAVTSHILSFLQAEG